MKRRQTKCGYSPCKIIEYAVPRRVLTVIISLVTKGLTPLMIVATLLIGTQEICWARCGLNLGSVYTQAQLHIANSSEIILVSAADRGCQYPMPVAQPSKPFDCSSIWPASVRRMHNLEMRLPNVRMQRFCQLHFKLFEDVRVSTVSNCGHHRNPYEQNLHAGICQHRLLGKITQPAPSV